MTHEIENYNELLDKHLVTSQGVFPLTETEVEHIGELFGVAAKSALLEAAKPAPPPKKESTEDPNECFDTVSVFAGLIGDQRQTAAKSAQQVPIDPNDCFDEVFPLLY